MKIFNLRAVSGTYKDPKTGEEKNRWVQIGKLFEHDGKITGGVIESIPVNFTGSFVVVPDDRDNKGGRAAETQQDSQPDTPPSDDLPF